jgi:hypothetical protein
MKLFCDVFTTFLYLKNDVNVPPKGIKHKNLEKNKYLSWQLVGH